MQLSFPRLFAVALMGVALVLAGCSEAGSVEDAKAKLEQAKQELAEAKAEADQAKVEVAEEQADTATDTRASANDQPICADCGTISVITPVQMESGPPEYVGAIVGGVAGAAVGSQIGSGSGTTIATIVGAVGGALAGREIQQRVTTDTYYKVQVSMDAGGSQTITVPSAQRIAVGTRVRVQGGNIVLM